jgi:hypothetical protein
MTACYGLLNSLSSSWYLLLSPDTIFDFRAAYRSENLALKYEQLVLLPFVQHPRLTAVEQNWADQGLVNGKFCLACKVTRLQIFAQSEEAPICSLDSLLYFQTHVIRWCHQRTY